MSLIGNMIATSYSGNPSIVNYSMFVSVFSMLSLLYLIPASIKESFMIHPLLVVGLDVLNAIFYFCGAVAMSAYLGVHSCGNSVSSNHLIYYVQPLTLFTVVHPQQLDHQRLSRHQ